MGWVVESDFIDMLSRSNGYASLFEILNVKYLGHNSSAIVVLYTSAKKRNKSLPVFTLMHTNLCEEPFVQTCCSNESTDKYSCDYRDWNLFPFTLRTLKEFQYSIIHNLPQNYRIIYPVLPSEDFMNSLLTAKITE